MKNWFSERVGRTASDVNESAKKIGPLPILFIKISKYDDNAKKI